MNQGIPITAFVTLAAVGVAAFWLTRGNASARTETKTKQASLDERVARGKYIVSTAGCHDCHTPWKLGPKGAEPDFTRALSGHPEDMKLPPPPAPQGPWIGATAATNTAFSGPWGVSFTANLTPDKETGLGTWTEQNFIQTIRSARHMGRGRPLLPPMPAPVYANLTDEDLAAVFAYLQTIPARKNHVPAPWPPAPQKG